MSYLVLDNILLDIKWYEHISIHHIAYKTSNDVKTLSIVFDKVDVDIRKYEWTKYLALFSSDEKCDKISDRINYHIMVKRNVSDVYSHNNMKIIIYSNADLSLRKIINNSAMLTKSAFN